jgi:hypothetical protein
MCVMRGLSCTGIALAAVMIWASPQPGNAVSLSSPSAIEDAARAGNPIEQVYHGRWRSRGDWHGRYRSLGLAGFHGRYRSMGGWHGRYRSFGLVGFHGRYRSMGGWHGRWRSMQW